MSLSSTLRRLPPAATDYACGLFDHHWSEAAWLYERRDGLRARGVLSADGWLELEARAEAHVRALARGDALVFEACEDRALEGDVGELHTAVRLMARVGDLRRLGAWIGGIDWEDPARAWAVVDALAWDAPEAWREPVAAMLGDPKLPAGVVGPLARVAGLRGWAVGESLLAALRRREGDLEPVAWALGVVGFGDALAELYAVLREPVGPAVHRAVAIAALRFAPGEVLAYAQRIAETHDWAAIPLALGGGPEVWPVLERVAKASPTVDRLLAVGLFGHVAGIEVLLDAVEDEDYGGAAAEGLYVLTGAELHREELERVSESDEAPDEDRDDPPGLRVRRLPRDQQIWAQWIEEHGTGIRGRFDTRVRGGRQAGPSVTLEEAGGVEASPQVRAWMIEELDVRYRLRVGAWPRRLEQDRRRADCHGRKIITAYPKVTNGAWYVAGQHLHQSVSIARASR